MRLSKKIFDNRAFWEYYAIRIFIKNQRGQKLAGKKIKPCITSTVKQIVANALGVPVAEITNKTVLSYFEAMAAVFDLHKKYPGVPFPEDRFDQFCVVGSLRNYVTKQMRRRQK